jgi:hypothetical protein
MKTSKSKNTKKRIQKVIIITQAHKIFKINKKKKKKKETSLLRTLNFFKKSNVLNQIKQNDGSEKE